MMVYRPASQMHGEGNQAQKGKKPMTEQVSAVRIKILEEVIRTVVHDLRIPKKLRVCLAAYQDQVAHLNEPEIRFPPADQTGPNRLTKTIPPGLSGICQTCAPRRITNEDRCILNCEHALIHRQIAISLWYNDESLDWSIEIDGQRHEHVTSDIMEALVECALIVAQIQLTKPYNRRPQ
jgi:hypothetical protein